MANDIPQGLDEFLGADSQDMAASGFKQLGKMALESEPVQNIISGQGLQKTNDMIGKAVEGDPTARQQLAENSAGMVANSIKLPDAPEGLLKSAKELFPGVNTFEDLYKAASQSLSPSNPIMKGLQQMKNRTLNFAGGGEVPEGLNSFLQDSPPTTHEDMQTLPESMPATALEDKSQPSTPVDDFIAQELKEEKYGTPTQRLITGAEGLAQGIAGPLAPMAEKALGIDEKDILARKETNPGTHLAGEIGGFVAPAIASGGTGLLAKAASLSQAGALEKVAGKLGLGAAETLAGRIGQGAAKGAIENMLLAGSDEVSRMVLNDPSQSADTALVDIGLAGAMGGALGGVSAGVLPLWKSSVGDKASKFVEDFRGRVAEHLANPEPVPAMVDELSNYYKGLTDRARGVSQLKAQNIAKVLPETVSDGMVRQSVELSDKVDKALMKLGDDPHARLLNEAYTTFKQGITSDSPVEVFNATQDFKKQLQEWGKYNKTMTPLQERPFRDLVKSLGRDARIALEDNQVWGKAADIQKGINRAFHGMVEGDIEAGAKTSTGMIASLKDFESKFTTEVAGERVVDPTKVNTYINQLGKPNAEIKQTMLKNFIGSGDRFNKEVDSLYHGAGLDSPISHSPMNVTMSSLNEKTLGSKVADIFIDKGLTDTGSKAIGGGIGAAGAHAAGLSKELGAIFGAYALGPFFKTIMPALSKSILNATNSATGMKTAVDYVIAITKGEALMNKAAQNALKAGSAVLPDHYMPKQRERERLQKQIDQLNSNPEKFILGDHNNLNTYLPDHSVAVNETIGRAARYIQSIQPDTGQRFPLDGKPVPTEAQKAQVRTALDIAQQPLVVLDKIQRGTITPDDMIALTSIYPSLYGKLQNKMLEAVTASVTKGQQIPYKTKLGLSMFLGQPLDSSMTPQAIQSVMSLSGAREPQGQQGGGQSRSPGSKSSPALQKMPDMYRTAEQSRMQHRSK